MKIEFNNGQTAEVRNFSEHKGINDKWIADLEVIGAYTSQDIEQLFDSENLKVWYIIYNESAKIDYSMYNKIISIHLDYIGVNELKTVIRLKIERD